MGPLAEGPVYQKELRVQEELFNGRGQAPEVTALKKYF